MFKLLFDAVTRELALIGRIIRAFFTRMFSNIRVYFRRVTSLVGQFFGIVPAMLSSLAVSGKKPSKRGDYIETKRLFIAKSWLVFIAAAIVVLACVGWFVARPLLISKFFTADFYRYDEKVTDYSGKVKLYYDKEKDMLYFTGRLSGGMAEGEGVASASDGSVIYSGEYKKGLYDGEGQLYENGILVYSGAFVEGVQNGSGTEYKDGVMVYKGGFEDGVRCGSGAEYSADGELSFRGAYEDGKRSGYGTEYYAGGTICYIGNYAAGERSGEGILYDVDGSMLYSGSFAASEYNGNGVLFSGKLRYEGSFSAGEAVGIVNIYRGQTLYYSGELKGLLPDGQGTLYGSGGDMLFTGAFRGGIIDGAALIGMTAAKIRESFYDRGLSETDFDGGFAIVSRECDITMFCTYKTEESDTSVRYVCVGDISAVQSPLGTVISAGSVPDSLEALIPVIAASNYYGDIEAGNGYVRLLWSLEPEGDAIAVEWCVSDMSPEAVAAMAGSTSSDTESAEAAEIRLSQLLDALGLGGDAS